MSRRFPGEVIAADPRPRFQWEVFRLQRSEHKRGNRRSKCLQAKGCCPAHYILGQPEPQVKARELGD